jgi:hypothetical protein
MHGELRFTRNGDQLYLFDLSFDCAAGAPDRQERAAPVLAPTFLLIGLANSGTAEIHGSGILHSTQLITTKIRQDYGYRSVCFLRQTRDMDAEWRPLHRPAPP